MSLRVQDTKWESLMQRVAEKEKAFPEFGDALSTLIRGMRTVKSLYGAQRISDVRLFSIDLDNLVQSVDMLSHAKSSGVDNEKLADSIGNVRSLIADMDQRVEGLVNDKLTEMRVHTAVAIGGLTPQKVEHFEPPVVENSISTDLHHEFENFGDETVTAKISGKFLSAEFIPAHRIKHVKSNICFLPEGRAMQISHGEAIAIWAGKEGDLVKDVMSHRVYRVEPVEGNMVILGPAFISEVADTSNVLIKNLGFSAIPPRTKTVQYLDSFQMILLSLGMVAFLLMRFGVQALENKFSQEQITPVYLFMALFSILNLYWIVIALRGKRLLSGGRLNNFSRRVMNQALNRRAHSHGLIVGDVMNKFSWERMSLFKLMTRRLRKPSSFYEYLQKKSSVDEIYQSMALSTLNAMRAKS